MTTPLWRRVSFGGRPVGPGGWEESRSHHTRQCGGGLARRMNPVTKARPGMRVRVLTTGMVVLVAAGVLTPHLARAQWGRPAPRYGVPPPEGQSGAPSAPYGYPSGGGYPPPGYPAPGGYPPPGYAPPSGYAPPA